MRKPSLQIAGLLLITAALVACQPRKADPTAKKAAGSETASVPVSTGGPPAPVVDAPSGDPTSIAVVPTTMGTRNFDQVNGTMEAVTGVTGNRNVINRFNNLKAQLPSDNDIKSFSFNAQGAITVLAAEYCTALVTNSNNMYATQLLAAIGNFNLAQVPTTAFAGNAPATLAQSLLTKFWGSNYATGPVASTALAAVVKLIADLPAGLANNTTTTRNTVIGACTSVLASAPVSTY